MAKAKAKKTAKKKATATKAKRLASPPVQDAIPGTEDEHQFHPDIEEKASEYCDMLQQQESWRKKARKAKPFMDQAMDKAGRTEYTTEKGHRVERTPGDTKTTVTLKKDADGLMEEPTGNEPIVTHIEVGEE